MPSKKNGLFRIDPAEKLDLRTIIGLIQEVLAQYLDLVQKVPVQDELVRNT